MRYAILLPLLLCSCSLNPVSWFGGKSEETSSLGGGPSGPPPDPITGAAETWLDMLLRFGWFGLILIFVVPGVRAPFIALWTAIFRVLTIPFEYAREKWESTELGQKAKARRELHEAEDADPS